MNIHELSTYNLADAVKFHRRLNPRIWGRDEHLLPEVREKLLTIAEDFQEFLGVDDLNIQDITISGSNAAYSYTKNSDIDLHLVVEMPADPVYQELFNAKKYQYNDEHNIKIGGADVELYVQPADQAHHSQGIYSIKNSEWKQIPQRKRAQVDDACVRDKVADLDSRIHAAVKSKNIEAISTLWDKIKAMRKIGLEQHGEFGCENIAFKMLRNSGCIKLLKDAMMAAQDRELSLREAPRQKFRYGFSEGMQSQPYSTSDGVAATTKSFLEDTENSNNIVKDFIQQVTTELGIDPVPEIHLHTDPDWSENNHSFGRYDPDSHTLNVSMPNRHVMDVLRTVAHELVHCSQNQQHGQLPDDAGATGSRWENDANARAGIIMRDWANSHPEHFELPALGEGASGYIPKNKREAAMPQYAMALSVDIKPGQTGKEANKLALNTGRNGEPGLLMKTVNLREFATEERSHPDKNRKYDSARREVKSILNSPYINLKEWGLSMTMLPKLGINPGKGISEDTPKGIYFYPLAYVNDWVNGSEELPWGNDFPYIQVFQYDTSHRMTPDTKVDPEKLKAALRQYCPEEVINQLIEEGTYNNDPYWFIYNCLVQVSKNDESTIIRWNKVLRDLGFTSVYDYGTGWIAHNEPEQGIILDPRIIKQVRTFDNYTRKDSLREYAMPQPSQGPGRYRDLNEPLGPETPPEMPAGTIKVDVSDMYDWYKLGQKISDLNSIRPGELGAGPPSTVFAFGSEDLENMYSHELTRLGLKTHDLDEPGEEDLDEGWRSALAGAAAAGAMAFSPAPAVGMNAPAAGPAAQPAAAVKQAPQQVAGPEAALTRAAKAAGMKGMELAQFLAQCAHETGDFEHMEELGGNKYLAQYDPTVNPAKAKSLGNTKAGDGAKYKGRGFIQITGKANYTKAGQALGIDLVNNPEAAARPDVAAKIAVWYWQNRVSPYVQNFSDTRGVTKRINPGLAGLQDRVENFKDYQQQVAGAAAPVKVAAAPPAQVRPAA